MTVSFSCLHESLFSDPASWREARAGYLHRTMTRKLTWLSDTPLCTDIRSLAAAARTEAPPALSFRDFIEFATSGERQRYEGPWLLRRKYLMVLFMEALADEQAMDVEAIENLIWAICDEYSWASPAHLPVSVEAASQHRLPPDEHADIFAAEVSYLLAEVVNALQHRLHPYVVFRVRAEMERRLFRPLFHHPERWWWEWTPMNWASVTAGGTGMAALLMMDDRERLAGCLYRCIAAMEVFLEGFGEDGGCSEGVSYWQYGFGYFVYFAEMLCDATAGGVDLLEDERIRAIASFPARVQMTSETFLNFSDAFHHFRPITGLLHRLHERVGSRVPALSTTASLIHNPAAAIHDVLWTDKTLFGRALPEAHEYFSNLGVVLERHYAHGIPVLFASKGGHNDEPHNHNDLGHFLIQVGHHALLADLGAGPYTRSYFTDQRYETVQASSRGHSVPLVAGEEQQQGREAVATVLEYRNDGPEVAFSLDLSAAYRSQTVREFRREFVWRRSGSPTAIEGAERSSRMAEPESANGVGAAEASRSGLYSEAATLTLRDRLSLKRPAEVVERFISTVPPVVQAGNVEWRVDVGAVRLDLPSSAGEPFVETIPLENGSLAYRLCVPLPASVEVDVSFLFHALVEQGETR